MTPRTAIGAFFVVVAGVASALGCAYYEDRASNVGEWLAPVDERTIHGDTAFTPRERAAVERACLEWATFTRGRVRLRVVWDLDGSNYATIEPPALYRVNRTWQTEPFGGRVDPSGKPLMWWIPDGCPDKEACMMHEIGHMLGLSHFAAPGHVMSERNPTHRFGPLDLAECERVGVCRDRTLDVTTVTVTIDPSIPNVEPNYP